MNPVIVWTSLVLAAFAIVMLGVVIAKRIRLRRSAAAGVPLDSDAARAEPVFGTWTEALAEQLPLPAGSSAAIQKELRLAGYYRPSALMEFNSIRFVLIFAACVLTGVAAVAMPASSTRNVLLVGLMFTALGFGLPRVFLAAQGRRRVRQIVRGLPDAVDLINMGVSRGLPFRQALERVQGQIHEIHPEVSRELDILLQQAQISSLEQGLRQLGRRIDTPELHTLTGLLTQSERLGTSLSTALDTYAASVRSSLKQNAERSASTAPFKLLFPIVLCMVPAVYMVLLGPAMIEISRFVRDRGEILGAPRDDVQRLGGQPISTPTQP